MSNPFIGEIRLFGGSFAPAGWAFCDGAVLPISENETLFNLIGTTYGGDGQSTFALPNLSSRVPMHAGNGFTLGEAAGVEQVTLTVGQLPVHTHPMVGSVDAATSSAAQGGVPASLTAAGTASAYGVLAPVGTLDQSSISPVGGSQPHENLQPYLAVNYIISLFGIFPHQ